MEEKLVNIKDENRGVMINYEKGWKSKSILHLLDKKDFKNYFLLKKILSDEDVIKFKEIKRIEKDNCWLFFYFIEGVKKEKVDKEFLKIIKNFDWELNITSLADFKHRYRYYYIFCKGIIPVLNIPVEFDIWKHDLKKLELFDIIKQIKKQIKERILEEKKDKEKYIINKYEIFKESFYKKLSCPIKFVLGEELEKKYNLLLDIFGGWDEKERKTHGMLEHIIMDVHKKIKNKPENIKINFSNSWERNIGNIIRGGIYIYYATIKIGDEFYDVTFRWKDSLQVYNDVYSEDGYRREGAWVRIYNYDLKKIEEEKKFDSKVELTKAEIDAIYKIKIERKHWSYNFLTVKELESVARIVYDKKNGLALLKKKLFHFKNESLSWLIKLDISVDGINYEIVKEKETGKLKELKKNLWNLNGILHGIETEEEAELYKDKIEESKKLHQEIKRIEEEAKNNLVDQINVFLKNRFYMPIPGVSNNDKGIVLKEYKIDKKFFKIDIEKENEEEAIEVCNDFGL